MGPMVNMQAVDIHANRQGLPMWEFIFVLLSCVFYTNYEVQDRFAFYATIVFTTYLLFCAFREPSIRKYTLTVLLFVALLSVLYFLLTDTLSIGDVVNKNIKRIYSKYGQFLFMFFPISIFFRTAKKATIKQVCIIMGVILFNAISLANIAITIARIDPEILHTFQKSALEAVGLNFTAFYFIYAFTFLVITGYETYKFATNKTIRYISLVLALFSFYFLVVAQFGLSIVTTIISLLVLYNVSAKNKAKKQRNIIITLILLTLTPLIIQAFIAISPSRILNDRLREIYDAFTGENTIEKEDGKGRLELYWMCIKAFFHSPIIGNRTLPLDGHATFLTVPADIGISGAIILYTLFKRAFDLFKMWLGEYYIYFIPLMVQIVLMGFTNPVHSSPSIYIFLFYFCPLVILVFIKHKHN